MSPLLSPVLRYVKRSAGPTRPRRSRRLALDTLEARAVPAGFTFSDFSETSPLSLVGDAAITADHRLRLTPALGGQEGGAWYTAEKQFVGLAFETTFQFQMTENADPPGGSDGLVFLIQNHAPTYLAGGGGTLGYHQLPNSLAVEFDTFQNSEVNDPSGSHISVHTNGTGPNDWSESLSLGSYSTSPALLDDAAVHTVKIAYTPGTLAVYLDNLATPKLTVAVDLAERLGLDSGKAWVGFTATTGGGWQNHDILNWTYSVVSDTTTTVWVGDASVAEGNSGTSALTFTVTRSGDTTGTTVLNWATEDRTATAGTDYVAASGQLVFEPGETQQTFSVQVTGDTVTEGHETFAVRLTGASGGSVSDGVGTGTILNDDVTISVSDATATEGGRALKGLGGFVSDGAGGLATPRGLTFGPDANRDGSQDLYVASGNTDAILRYDGRTGSFIDAFVSPGSGGLDSPVDQAFGPDGHLYVSSFGTNQILKYDGVTGSFIGAVASGLASPLGLTFGADGSLYIANQDTHEILRYHDSTLSVFVSAGSGGLSRSRQAVFGPDGNGDGAPDLYVAGAGTGKILRYDGLTGAFLGTFAESPAGMPGSFPDRGHAWLEFGTDGHLYTTARTTADGLGTSILRFDAATGAFVDTLALGRDGWSFILGPDNLVYNSGNSAGGFVDRLGPSSLTALTVSLGSPSASAVTVAYATANVTALAGSDYTGAGGTLTFAPGETAKTVLIPTLDDGATEPTETFTLSLSTPVGAAIADGTGVATITDDDGTKFFVVDDGSPDRTYRYGAPGNAQTNTSLAAGNTAPRGAASNAAGDTLWVLDANKTVYVYNPSGGLLGSWSAGSMTGTATPEGIATDGTDVWIVDSKSDKVFKYTGAATLLSGSQNAASSISLNSGNKNPKGIVTDGTHLWVVNDAATDKVFKYTLGMSPAGSWTIDPANASPTGITLDPTNVGHLWVVDSGTDRVYQYDSAAGRTSGSQAASVSFALAAGNTNPQDIADPPAADDGPRPMPVWPPAGGPGPAQPAGPDDPDPDVPVERGPAGRQDIVGPTADRGQPALAAVFPEWTSGRTSPRRVVNLTDGSGPSPRANGNVFLNPATVWDDGARDSWTGPGGPDWFLFNQDEDGGPEFGLALETDPAKLFGDIDLD